MGSSVRALLRICGDRVESVSQIMTDESVAESFSQWVVAVATAVGVDEKRTALLRAKCD